MGQRSSIDKLPDETKVALDQRLMAGVYTLDELCEWLEEAGCEISRSALHRHKSKLDNVAEKMREAQTMADALVNELGPSIKGGQHFRMLSQILQTLAFRTMTASMEDDADFDAKDIHFIARSLKDLVSAQTLEDSRIRKIQSEEREAAAVRVKSAATSQGLSDDTVKAIERAVLGVELG